MTLETLIANLPRDVWRDESGFSADLEHAHRHMSRGDAAEALGEWLAVHQLCQFSRWAAREGRLHWRVIGEDVIERGDDAVAEAIRQARLAWLRAAFRGEAAGLVLLLASPRIAFAAPTPELAVVAKRFASLYCSRAVDFDEIALDDIYLGRDSETAWRWSAPLNFFASQADGRWWSSRRIPGGMALSINSVGHLVLGGLLGSHGAAHALRYTRVTLQRASRVTTEQDSYAAPFDTDITLPSSFFTSDEAGPPPARITRAMTTEFECGAPAGMDGACWSDAAARGCGCGQIVPLCEVPADVVSTR